MIFRRKRNVAANKYAREAATRLVAACHDWGEVEELANLIAGVNVSKASVPVQEILHVLASSMFEEHDEAVK